jgi:epoxide hydrolase 4
MRGWDSVFYQSGQVRLHAVQSGDPDGPLAVLLHGFPEFWRSWIHQIDALASAGFWVIAPDQRGYNLSDRPALLDDYRTKNLVGDIVGLLDSTGRQKAHLVGHDWGGIAAWQLALQHPERVEKLAVLNAPHPTAMARHLSRSPRQMLRSLYALFFQLPGLPEAVLRNNDWQLLVEAMVKSSQPGAFSEEDFEQYRQAWWKKGAMTAMLNWYRAAFRFPDLPANPILNVPALILWGMQDFALHSQLARDSLEYCPLGRLVLLENATHWLQHEQPERINQELLAFLSG